MIICIPGAVYGFSLKPAVSYLSSSQLKEIDLQSSIPSTFSLLGLKVLLCVSPGKNKENLSLAIFSPFWYFLQSSKKGKRQAASLLFPFSFCFLNIPAFNSFFLCLQQVELPSVPFHSFTVLQARSKESFPLLLLPLFSLCLTIVCKEAATSSWSLRFLSLSFCLFFQLLTGLFYLSFCCNNKIHLYY